MGFKFELVTQTCNDHTPERFMACYCYLWGSVFQTNINLLACLSFVVGRGNVFAGRGFNHCNPLGWLVSSIWSWAMFSIKQGIITRQVRLVKFPPYIWSFGLTFFFCGNEFWTDLAGSLCLSLFFLGQRKRVLLY